MRKIIHVDMDAFYASVEQRDFPEYAGRPIAVGSSSGRGVVAAASYEARAFGVHSAMPSKHARRLCPDLLFVRPRFDVYRQVSQQIREVFLVYTDLVEPLSLDEAYLDVTHPKQGPPSATLIAQRVKAEILTRTGLTASAGVSVNKFLAKIASDMEKPDGLTLIRPGEAECVVAALPVACFHGVGPVTADRMQAMGIRTGADLRERPERELVAHFGKRGRYFYRIARGQDDRAVEPDRERKSIGAERTFSEDVEGEAAMLERLRPIAERVAERMERHEVWGMTVTLKIKYHDFELTTRSRTFSCAVHEAEALYAAARELLCSPEPPVRAVRLLGVTVSSLSTEQMRRTAEQLAFPF